MRNQSTSLLWIAHKLVAFQNSIVLWIVFFPKRARPDKNHFRRFGTPYGGWWIPNLIATNDELSSKKILISAGLGHDVSFDDEMARIGFQIIGLDPLSDCISHAKSVLSKHGNRVILIENGLWDSDGKIKFYEPKIQSHDSLSTINAHSVASGKFLEFGVTSIGSLFETFPKIAEANFLMLKMDIEGSELAVLKNIIEKRIHFNFLAVELDFLSLIPFTHFFKRVKLMAKMRLLNYQLQSVGYTYLFNEGFNAYWAKI